MAFSPSEFVFDAKPVKKEVDKKMDDLFSDFTVPDPPKPEDMSSKISEKREIMDLLGYKISLTYLEKVLIVLKNNVLSEGKCMGHIGIEFAGAIDPSDSEGMLVQ